MKIKLIKFNKNNKEFLLKLRNKKSSRTNSFSNQKIIAKDHTTWFKNFISNPKNLGFIIKINSKIIGYLRYDDKGLHYEISLSILPNFQKKGYASEAIKLSERKLKKKLIIAKVMKGNKNSELFFQNNNYELLEMKNTYKIYIRFINHKNYIKEFKLIDEIQNIRKRNNVNWMNILKIAFLKAPNQTKKIFKKVSIDDKLINIKSRKLFS